MKLPEGMKKILKHFLQYLTALKVGKNKRNSNNNLDLPFQAAVLNIPGVIIGTVLLYLQNTVLKRQKEVLWVFTVTSHQFTRLEIIARNWANFKFGRAWPGVKFSKIQDGG